MTTIRKVIQLALFEYDKYSFMCNNVEEMILDHEDIQKTLDFIKSQLNGYYTLTNFLSNTVPEYQRLCDSHPDGYESDKPHAFRLKWWTEVIKLPEAQI